MPHEGLAREMVAGLRYGSVVGHGVGMGSGLSMSARREITTKYAKAYWAASKSGKARMLDELVAVTGWSRANARRAAPRLGSAGVRCVRWGAIQLAEHVELGQRVSHDRGQALR